MYVVSGSWAVSIFEYVIEMSVRGGGERGGGEGGGDGGCGFGGGVGRLMLELGSVTVNS